MRLKLKEGRLLLFGDFTYRNIKEFQRRVKNLTFDEIDVRNAKILDTSFIVFLLKTGKEIVASDKQNELIDIVRSNLKDRPLKVKKRGFFYKVGF